MQTIGEIRALSGLSRAEFSRRYGIPVRTLQDWESGKRKSPDYLAKLLYRTVVEDKINEDLSCYDKDVLKELGACYGELLRAMNPKGRNPYPYADIFPTKYFTMVHKQAVQLGLPESLEQRIGLLMNHINPDDWCKSMYIPVPMGKQHYFVLGMIDVFNKNA